MLLDPTSQMALANEKLAVARCEVRRLRIRPTRDQFAGEHRHRHFVDLVDATILRASRGAARRQSAHAEQHALPITNLPGGHQECGRN